MAKWTMEDIKKTVLPIKIPGKEKHIPLSEKFQGGTSKYHNKKTNGFDSKKEADFYKGLKFKEKAGLVTGISCQVSFQLSVCVYIADYVYYDRVTESWQVVDVKSEITKKLPTFRLKKKMMLNELKIKIIEV